MSLATPGKIRELQNKLYRKAKNEPGYRFYQLYDKVYREDAGYTEVVDADWSQYFDTIPHAALLPCVARRVVDRQMRHLIKMWLKVPVEERDENGRRRLTGGKDNDRGTPPGGAMTA